MQTHCRIYEGRRRRLCMAQPTHMHHEVLECFGMRIAKSSAAPSYFTVLWELQHRSWGKLMCLGMPVCRPTAGYMGHSSMASHGPSAPYAFPALQLGAGDVLRDACLRTHRRIVEGRRSCLASPVHPPMPASAFQQRAADVFRDACVQTHLRICKGRQCQHSS